MKKILLFVCLITALASLSTVRAQSPLTYRVDDINDLVQITLYGSDAKVLAQVGGATARDDGQGGAFFYDGTSSVTTNTYAVFKPVNNTGRWFKLPTAVAFQNGAVNISDATTYAWHLLRNAQTNVFGIGADNSNVYLQSHGKQLNLNQTGQLIAIGQASTPAIQLGGPTATAFIALYSANAQIDFPSMPPNSVTNMTLTVTGAGTNSTVSVSVTDGVGTPGITVSGFVSATNTVTIRAANPTLGTIDPAAAISYRATVIQY